MVAWVLMALAVVLGGYALAGWWMRRRPSALPYSLRFFLAVPRRVLRRERLRDGTARHPGHSDRILPLRRRAGGGLEKRDEAPQRVPIMRGVPNWRCVLCTATMLLALLAPAAALGNHEGGAQPSQGAPPPQQAAPTAPPGQTQQDDGSSTLLIVGTMVGLIGLSGALIAVNRGRFAGRAPD